MVALVLESFIAGYPSSSARRPREPKEPGAYKPFIKTLPTLT
jgi:hypothetical protein